MKTIDNTIKMQYAIPMSKRNVTYRLTGYAITRLMVLAEDRGLSKSSVVERLIREAELSAEGEVSFKRGLDGNSGENNKEEM